jgi:hypothetical protein
MTKRYSAAGIIILAFLLLPLAACDNYNSSFKDFYGENPADGDDGELPPFTGVDDLPGYLAASPNGGSPDDPVVIRLDIDLADTGGNGWEDLLTMLDGQAKYVSLDLSACDMDGTEFNPDFSNSTGKDKIVSLILPNKAESIIDSWPTQSAFLHFDALKSVSGVNVVTIKSFAFSDRDALITVDFPKAATIEDFSFLSCSFLTTVSFPELTFIDSGAFKLCGSLTTVSLPKIADIGVGLFEDCPALTSLTLGKNAAPWPILRAVVFQNTNPGPPLTIHVPAGTVPGYTGEWGVLASTGVNGNEPIYGINHKEINIVDY